MRLPNICRQSRQGRWAWRQVSRGRPPAHLVWPGHIGPPLPPTWCQPQCTVTLWAKAGLSGHWRFLGRQGIPAWLHPAGTTRREVATKPGARCSLFVPWGVGTDRPRGWGLCLRSWAARGCRPAPPGGLASGVVFPASLGPGPGLRGALGIAEAARGLQPGLLTLAGPAGGRCLGRSGPPQWPC